MMNDRDTALRFSDRFRQLFDEDSNVPSMNWH
jgi:hypothetical protein